MILATGKPSSRRRCAFTLIELILVMTLLVVAVSMIAPKLSGFIRGRALDSEANRLLALAHAGQSRAVSEGMPMVLWFDQPNGTYGLEEETAPAGGDAQREMMEMAATVQLTVVNLAGSAPTTFRKLPALRFLADGTIDEDSPHTLQLVDSAGFSLWLVEMQNRTGYEIRDTGN
jgi:prepilin-type N-terminal cleavage/methylation domain-containing protein